MMEMMTTTMMEMMTMHEINFILFLQFECWCILQNDVLVGIFIAFIHATLHFHCNGCSLNKATTEKKPSPPLALVLQMNNFISFGPP